MAVSREQLIFDVFANTARAESGFTAVGRKAAAASDDVSALAKRLDDLSAKSASARVKLEGDKDATAKLDKLDLKLATLGSKTARPDVTIEGAARAAVEISALDAELDHLSSKSADAGKATSSLAGIAGNTNAGGLGALIGLGVVLSPIIATLGTGLGGLALAALGAGKNSKILAQELAPLKNDFAGFQQELQPTILYDFAKAAGVARTVLHDIEPVTVATGKALGGMLGAIDAEFKSNTWQQFFGFMARTAGPDMKLLTGVFTGLLQVLPPLLEDLQPVAQTILKDTGGLLQLVGAAEKAINAEHNLGQEASHSTGWFGALASAVGQAAKELVPGASGARDMANELGKLGDHLNQTQTAGSNTAAAFHQVTITTGNAAEQITESSRSALLAVSPYNRLGKLASDLVQAQAGIASTSRPVVTNFDAQMKSLSGLVTGYGNALTALENYINAQIAEAGDLQSVNQALKLSHDRIGFQTQAQRNAYSAIQTFIKQTTDTGDAAVKTGKGIQGQINIIQNALPALEHVKGKTAEYRAELNLLKNILDKLRAEKLISEVVHVTGQGTWRFGAAPGGSVAGPGGRFAPAGGAAAGGLIGGGIPGRDSVPIMAMPGEVVVPAGMVRAGAVDHLRGSLPGFAAGGIVPSYNGSMGGLPPWTSANQQATIMAIGTSIGNAMASSFASMAGFGTAGPGGGQPAANAALARRMMPAWGSGAEWAAWNYVAMRESGWNQFARNPSSGAYGIPQALPPGKMGPAANPPQSNPAAQISWMIGYIRSVYGDPIGAASHERSAGWYDHGGWLHPGVTMAVNNTGKSERVLPPGASSGALVNVQTMVVQDATDAALVAQRLSFAMVAAGLS